MEEKGCATCRYHGNGVSDFPCNDCILDLWVAQETPATHYSLEADGDEEAGEANLQNSYDRVRAVHNNYASVGDPDWDATVLANEIDRLRLELYKRENHG